MKRALIIGVTGQDGPYLAKLLVSKGYKVFGGYRRSSTRNFWRLHYLDVKKDIEMVELDLLDQTSLLNAIQLAKPDEIYNLAAQSFVGVSFEEAIATGEIVGLGVTRILDSIRTLDPKIKFYQASTSELYGNVPAPQNEDTPFHPNSPYAAAKLYAHWVTKAYRTGYNMFTCAGILFNHESPLRGIEFVTKKITDGVARIKMGYIDKIYLGNLEAKRDWGFAGDYVEAMWLMLQQKNPDDYVVATGESHTVGEFCKEAFSHIGLDYKKYVEIDKKFFRPNDVNYLMGDASKARKVLGWKPKVNFKELVKMMVEADLDKYQNPTKYTREFLKHI
ncbi:MAG: GDPmannose 4,6-dehydratase [Parcubacteria group bacterium Athens0714_24]|nr:MAG: GDPmannose 4,6-dehydratase [Parcubacteria group bacterium Athens0714_24]